MSVTIRLQPCPDGYTVTVEGDKDWVANRPYTDYAKALIKVAISMQMYKRRGIQPIVINEVRDVQSAQANIS